MPEITPAYRKIATTSWFSRFLPGMRNSLYVADDHLLLATQMIIFEKYHRFFFPTSRRSLRQKAIVGYGRPLPGQFVSRWACYGT